MMLTDEQIDALWPAGLTIPQIVQRRAIARAVERALQPQWSDQPPTAPGWYWWQVANLDAICIRVHKHEGNRWLITYPWTEDPEWEGTMAGQWAGPITPPEE